MKNTNTFGVIFYLRKYKVLNGKAPIYARITFDGKRVDLSVKQSIEESNWNGSKGMAKGSREEVRSLNAFLERVKANIVSRYQELLLQRKPMTAEIIKNSFLGADKEEHTLCKVIDYHNTTMGDSLAPGTMKNYYTTQKYVKKFLMSKFRRSDIHLSELTYKFISDFEFFLRKYKPEDFHKPLGNNGLMKHMERFRKMISMAVRMEWLEKDPFAKYQQKFDKVERDFLTEEELSIMENKGFTVSRLEWVRDLFVFSCYTGLAYIDTMRLTPANITKGMDGELWLMTKRKKTSNPVRVPLLPKALTLIEKYKDHPRASSKGTLLPIISNQKLNSYLKEIADLCDIKKNLTFHLARHTFATTVTLTNGVPIESVSKMLGHSKISTTQVYAKVIEKKLSEDMKNLRDKLSIATNKTQM
jgi:site-specific recombinase XerD